MKPQKSNLDFFRTASAAEIAEWIAKNSNWENSEYMQWVDDNHCKKCKPYTGYVEEFDREVEFYPCECEEYPHKLCNSEIKDIIEAWLSAERSE